MTKKRVMRQFAIDEISAVTKPAQKGARMVLMKRDASGDAAAKAAKIAKGDYVLTTTDLGHQHLISLDDMTELRGSGQTESAECGDGNNWHSHPFIIDAAGNVTIGDAMRHRHKLAAPSQNIEELEAAGVIGEHEEDDESGDAEKTGDSVGDGDAVTKREAAKQKGNTMVDIAEKKLAELVALAGMTDVQKAFYEKLNASDREVFAAADGAGRNAAIAKASESDPVVYTTAGGVQIRKSDGAVAAQLAREMDKQAQNNAALLKTLEVTKAAADAAEVERIVKELVHIGKPIEEKRAMVGAILKIDDEAVRKSALDALTAGAGRFGDLLKHAGVVTLPTQTGGPLDRLEEMAHERVSKSGDGETYEMAYAKAMMTPEGSRLYSEYLAANGHDVMH